MNTNGHVKLAQVFEVGEAAVEQYRAQGIDTNDRAIAADLGRSIVDRLRAAGLNATADDLARGVADLTAFGRDGFELIALRWWVEQG